MTETGGRAGVERGTWPGDFKSTRGEIGGLVERVEEEGFLLLREHVRGSTNRGAEIKGGALVSGDGAEFRGVVQVTCAEVNAKRLACRRGGFVLERRQRVMFRSLLPLLLRYGFNSLRGV